MHVDDRLLLKLAATTFLVGLCAVVLLDGPRDFAIADIPDAGLVRLHGIVTSVRERGPGFLFVLRDVTGEATVLTGYDGCMVSTGMVVTLEGRVRIRGKQKEVVAGDVQCSGPSL